MFRLVAATSLLAIRPFALLLGRGARSAAQATSPLVSVSHMLQAQPTGEGELRSSKHVYWTDDEIQAGKWIVLPNLRVARLHHLSGDRRVFITTDGKLVCEHGECSSSICSWLSAEQRARKEGVELPQRNSACDCENTDGLH